MGNQLYPVTQPIKVYLGLDGQPLNGGSIYFGLPNQNPITNPTTMYWDAAGTIAAAQPLRTVNGFITRQGTPANIYAFGDCSVVIYDSKGNIVFTQPTSTDLQLALAIAGASTAAAIPLADAGNYYPGNDNVEAALQVLGPLQAEMVTALAALVPTGATFDYCGLAAPTGWIFADGNTIGNAASGAGGGDGIHNSAATQALFVLLWQSYDNTRLHIQDNTGTPTTRGASALIDYGNNRRMPVPDARNRARVALDTNVGGLSNRLTAAGSGIDGTIMGNSGGVETFALVTANLASHTHTFTGTAHNHGIGDPGHIHAYNAAANSTGATGGGIPVAQLSASSTGSSQTGITINNTTAAGTNSNTGSGTAHQNTQPTIIFTAIIKL